MYSTWLPCEWLVLDITVLDITYVREETEQLNRLAVELGGETLENVLEVVGGLDRDVLQSILDNGHGTALLELDNVAVGIVRLNSRAGDERSRLGALGNRASNSQRQKGEDGREAHDVYDRSYKRCLSGYSIFTSRRVGKVSNLYMPSVHVQHRLGAS